MARLGTQAAQSPAAVHFKTSIPWLTALGATAIALAAPPCRAAAADTVPATGKVVFADGESGLHFEPGELESEMNPLRLIVYDERSRRLEPEEVRAKVIAAEAEAIEGTAAIELGGNAGIYAVLDLRRVRDSFAGRRVEIRFWQRTLGTRMTATLNWIFGDVDGYLDRDEYENVDALGYILFQPTGRATDDGWEEWTSGPFDWLIAHAIAPPSLAFADEQSNAAGQGAARYNPAMRARVDALTIADLGPALVPEASCTLVSRDAVCGEHGTCLYGRCADAAPILGPLVQNADLRRDYLDRYALAFTTFEGGRAPLAKGAALRSALDALAGETSARRFREGLSIAVAELGDGHASPPYPSYRSAGTTGVCAYISDADLLPERAELPMVFDFDGTTPIGLQLRAGDVVTAIDGLPPRDWAALARAHLAYGGDPLGRETIEAASLFDAALDYGATISLARCADTSTVGSPAPCTFDHLTRFDLDLAAEARPIFENTRLEWMNNPRICDFRFRRAIEGPRVREYAFAGSTDEDGARILHINGVPAQEWDGGRAWFRAVDNALDDAPQRVILDERYGGGGSPDAVDRIAAYLIDPSEYYAAQLFPRIAQELTPEIYQRLLNCVMTPVVVIGMCGNFSVWPLGGFNHPNIGLIATSRLAVVNGLDVSGNDFLPKMLTYRKLGETRFFGPAPTYGAFGAIVSMPALLGDYYGGSFQIQDTVFAATPESRELEFTTSSGIPPDERVIQKQSDAVRGIDTVLEAAKAWVLQ